MFRCPSVRCLSLLDPVLETNDDFMTPAAPTAATDKAHQGIYTYRFPRTQIKQQPIVTAPPVLRFTTCWDTDPCVGQGAAPRTCQGRCTAAPLASAQLPSARRIATEQLPTQLAAASAHRRRPPLCPPLCACGPRTHARPQPQPAARSPQHAGSRAFPLSGSQRRGGRASGSSPRRRRPRRRWNWS